MRRTPNPQLDPLRLVQGHEKASLGPETSLYGVSSEEMGWAALDEFEQVWGVKYTLVVHSWRNNWPELSTFFKYPPEIRKIIYTMNMIGSHHRQLRKVTKGKSIFPSDEALLKMLYLVT